ncbi:mitochondrial dicarboxylate carrier [Tanacetum coccineum]
MSKVGTLASEVCLLKVTWVRNLNSIRFSLKMFVYGYCGHLMLLILFTLFDVNKLSYYSVGKKRKRRKRRKVTGHFVSPHGLAAEYVGSGGARTEGVTSWYIDIGDSGFAPTISSNPVYVIKDRVMNMKVVEGVKPPYKGMIDYAVNTVEVEVPMCD